VLKLVFRYRATGIENLPRDGGYVLAANHVSNFDPFPLGPLIAAAGAFKVRRGEHDLDAMRTAEQLVREGHVVVMFPEGTRREKGLRKKWQPRAHTGAARIALGAGAPLVPAAIAGTDRITRLGRLKVVYGKPIPLDGVDAEEATERLMAEIGALEATL
jgi:1-acyl-sn-glycerol-3-phosphate acyltransferase